MRVYLRSLATNSTVSIEALQVKAISNQAIPFPDETVIGDLRDRIIDTTSPEPEYAYDNNIAVLIGSDFYWDVMTGNIQSLGPTLKAIETRLGWTVHG